MKKKIFALTLTAVMMCFVLSGCTENETYSIEIEDVQDVEITDDITVSAAGYGFADSTCYVNVTVTNTSDEDLGIIIEKVLLNGLTEIEIGMNFIVVANGEKDVTVAFELDRAISTVTSADIYVVAGGEGDVYHLDLE